MPKLQSKIKLKTPRLHFRYASDRLETTRTAKLSPIPEVVWQQPPKTSINQFNSNGIEIDSTKQTAQVTQRLIVSHVSDVASQTSPRKRNHPQNHVITTEHPNGNQTGNKPVLILSCSNSCPNEIQESVKHTVTTRNGDTIPPFSVSQNPPQQLKKGW